MSKNNWNKKYRIFKMSSGKFHDPFLRDIDTIEGHGHFDDSKALPETSNPGNYEVHFVAEDWQGSNGGMEGTPLHIFKTTAASHHDAINKARNELYTNPELYKKIYNGTEGSLEYEPDWSKEERKNGVPPKDTFEDDEGNSYSPYDVSTRTKNFGRWGPPRRWFFNSEEEGPSTPHTFTQPESMHPYHSSNGWLHSSAGICLPQVSLVSRISSPPEL